MPEDKRDMHSEGTKTTDRQETSEAFTELSQKLMCELRLNRQLLGAAAPRVEELLQNHGLAPATFGPDLLTDLVYTEWMLRLESGESISREEYCLRFPEIRHLLERQWTLDQSLADIAGESTAGPDNGLSSERSDALPFGSHYIGKYKIISPLGSGGQGDVYRALHPDLSRDVVIKLIRPRYQPGATIEFSPSDPQMKAALSEGRLLAQLFHPHIAQIFDIDQIYGYPFLVMEYVQGHSLDQYHRLQKLNAQQTANLVGQIALAVAAAHERGILHRDIKPQNIVVTAEGHPKLIDFGLARISDVWQTRDDHPGLCGTLAYLSPEQAAGDTNKIGAATDIFALGAVLFFLLTGEPLYSGSSSITGVSLEGLLERARKCEWDRSALRRPDIPGTLAAICEQALQPEPSARFASARELADALARSAKPKRIPAFLIATIVIVLLGSIALLAWPSPKAPKQSAPISQDVTPFAGVTVLKPVIHMEDARIELLDAVPLSSGTLLHLESEMPAGVTFVLLSVNGKGAIQKVATFPAQAQNWQWRYPEPSTDVMPLTGPAGTECLILMGTTNTESLNRDLDANTFGSVWQEVSDWPPLAPTTLLRLRGAKVSVEQSGRDLGSPQRAELNPTEKVTMSLEKFAAKLQSSYPLIEGIAFSHIDAAD